MAINDADQTGQDGLDGGDSGASDESTSDGPTDGSTVRVGEYTWREFMREFGYEDEVSTLYRNVEDSTSEDSSRMGLGTQEGTVQTVPEDGDWDRVDFDPETYLGVHPDDLAEHITEDVAPGAKWLWNQFTDAVDPETTPVVKDEWTWEHFKWQYYYEDDGSCPTDGNGEKVQFDETDHLSFEDDEVEGVLSQGDDFAQELADVVEERTVNVKEDVDEDEFFSDPGGNTTVVNRYDLEKSVPLEKKTHFREEERYWVNKPYAFVIIFLSEKENEVKYYVVQPYMNQIEDDLEEFMTGKLRTAIKYSDEDVAVEKDEDARRDVIDRETKRLLKRYDLFEGTPATSDSAGAASGTQSITESIQRFFGTAEAAGDGALETGADDDAEGFGRELDGIAARPEPAVLGEDAETLNEYQVEKLLYFLKRDFIGYERIDPIKHDINVEDISCNGHNSPIFVYHGEYEQIITNIYHGERELDDFVVKLAQRSGKGISKRRPQVDATLPDGSRAQLTLGKEVSDHGTNYTIRQFNDVPFTPVDLINWNTFSLDEMAFLWLCIENHKSLIFAGGTASGKTTSLNAISLFIPSNGKIVSIEDTREVELPQRNWIASVTRPSFSEDSQGDVDEFDLLEAALRQRPDYIVMGEIRGEEGRTLFQVMSTGHTTYTTFHADSVGEVLKRFTTDPINVSKTMFTALDLVSIQTQTRVGGHKVRRNRNITEINHYDAENDEINVQDVYQWQAETDEFLKMGDSNTLDEIKFDRGWGQEKLEEELFKRRVILAYIIKTGLNEYAQVAATVQAFINDPETILTLIANGQLEESLQDLREMESVLIDVDPEDEELVPRPDPDDETYNLAQDILERAEESMFEEYRGKIPSGLASALSGVSVEEDVDVEEAVESDDEAFDFGSSLDDVDEDGFMLGGGDDGGDDDFSFGESDDAEGPSWLSDDGGGFSFGEDDGDANPFRGSSESGEESASPDAADVDAPPAGTPELESGRSGQEMGGDAHTEPSDATDAGDPTVGDSDSVEPEAGVTAEDDGVAFGEDGAAFEADESAFDGDAGAFEGDAGEFGEDGSGPEDDAGDIDAEFPSLTDETDATEGEDEKGTEANEDQPEADEDGSDADADGTVGTSGDRSDVESADSGGDTDASDGPTSPADAGSTETTPAEASADEPDDVIFGEDEETTGAAVEDDGDDAFFGDDDEPFFDESEDESIFGESDGSVFDDGDDDSVFGGEDAQRRDADSATDEDSVFGGGGGGVFDDGDGSESIGEESSGEEQDGEDSNDEESASGSTDGDEE
ncbi:Flp pilus assembly complex ATPase component TadA [Halorubellus sp. JP-L1]|uniref:ATPase, T2SS/T4P/T4SS family n=1 Tax=Halorubellus sp. JP-L1 TaxID=2715753 RepID=UPI00140E13F4|nr:Flp pilus assembly complex ATPase component TadA [Halorubellus sp. JP-L1]